MFIDDYFPLYELKRFYNSMKMTDAKQGRYFKKNQKKRRKDKRRNGR